MDSKKIGILNLQHSNFNYGAVLQAWAIEKHVEAEGFQVKHLNYVPHFPETPPKTLSEFIRSFIKHLLPKGMIKKLKLMNSQAYEFENFRKVHLNLTKEINTNQDLCEISGNFDSIIVGSDQVWRTRYTKPFSLAYFLSFVPNHVNRVSYAASFGVDEWEEKDTGLTELIVKEIAKFKAISVREDSGVKICRDIFGVEAQHVLDPTFLVGRQGFEKLIKHYNPQKLTAGIVYYKLDTDAEFLSKLDGLKDYLSLEKDNIYHAVVNNKRIYKPVLEWLSNIRDSQLVITDSYHCVCFAIIFNKNFICISNPNRGLSRLESLLSLLNLNNHICMEDEDLVSKIKSLEKIDYNAVSIILDSLRTEANTFLMKQISS